MERAERRGSECYSSHFKILVDSFHMFSQLVPIFFVLSSMFRVLACGLRQGLVFAACVGQPKLHLFDTRNYAKGWNWEFSLPPL